MIRLLLTASLLLAACGRSPGPNPEEYGQISYWLLNQSEASSVNCTDDPRFESLRLQPPDFSQMAWYYIYRVSDDGRTAIGYDCEHAQAYDANACWPEPEEVWQIADHVATLDFFQDPIPLVDGCRVERTGRLQLTDDGDEGSVRIEVRHSLAGNQETCESAEAALRAQSPNGQGLRDCIHALDEVVYFAKAVEPVR